MIDVAAAIITDGHNRILIARRKPGKFLAGLWEFPGGKIEKGETAGEALERELMEEMELAIQTGERAGESVHAYEDFTVRLVAHYAKIVGGEIKLVDHDSYAWVPPALLENYDMPAADIPLRRMLLDMDGEGI